MLENINILAGGKPVRTGDLRRDFDALDDFVNRLLRGLEHSFEQLDRRLETLERRMGNE